MSSYMICPSLPVEMEGGLSAKISMPLADQTTKENFRRQQPVYISGSSYFFRSTF